jgi:uncharacterized metal-binding protein YceD (DUF177 family)
MFKIQFSGLSLGHHPFEFHIDDTFFKTFDYEEISSCDIDVSIDLEKTERFLKLDFQFDGEYFVPCDRCLDLIEIPIQHAEQLIVNFGDEDDFDSEVWTISGKEHVLFLDDFIYETLVLLRPFSVTHEVEDCNPEMLAKLQNSPNEKSEGDPRWDALKYLRGNIDKK